jgi:arginyl-tRNA synthetase
VREIRDELRQTVSKGLTRLLEQRGEEGVDPDQVVVENPPSPDLGDVAFPMFGYAKLFRGSPQSIAVALKELLDTEEDLEIPGSAVVEGPYLNVRLDSNRLSGGVLDRVFEKGDEYGRSDLYVGEKTVVEFSCPNTNKPLHLGHLRNDAIGESIARIYDFAGAEVRKVNLINDRGIHICKSMLAYTLFGEGKTPEEEPRKSDHFVGDYYVRYTAYAAEEPQAELQAREMLRAWEKGDPKTMELWTLMNRWAIEGIEETYRRTGISFDMIYFESQTYSLGREEVLKGLERDIFYRDEEGTVWVDLTDEDLDKKVLLRNDGTSLYITQDIGTAIARNDDWGFTKMIYVVGSEQQYHFKVLFSILRNLGYAWADNCFHLSYGMVNLPEGKMKSREGTVVDADDLIDELSTLALEEIRDKGREEEITDPAATAEKVALGALHFYLLQTNPGKDMIFDPKKSISFNGSTGPYLQYTCARISNMLRKYEERKDGFAGGKFTPKLLTVQDEWTLVKAISDFPETVESAAREFNPSILAGYLYELAKVFSHYYHENPVLHNEDPDLVVTRITLTKAVLQVLKNGLELINVPFLDRM